MINAGGWDWLREHMKIMDGIVFVWTPRLEPSYVRRRDYQQHFPSLAAADANLEIISLGAFYKTTKLRSAHFTLQYYNFLSKLGEISWSQRLADVKKIWFEDNSAPKSKKILNFGGSLSYLLCYCDYGLIIYILTSIWIFTNKKLMDNT